MFERFTDRARRVIVYAQEEAARLNHPEIGTEHLLLGLLAEGEGVAALVLKHQEGITLEHARAMVELRWPRAETWRAGHVPFTRQLRQTLELALREALKLSHNYIGTEHLLLGIAVSGADCNAIEVLVKDFDLRLVDIRCAIFEQLKAYEAEHPTELKLTVAEAKALQRWLHNVLAQLEMALPDEHPLRPLLRELQL